MGGRGASSGMSRYIDKDGKDKGNPYGSQYKSLYESGSIKFVTKKSRQSEPLLETMTKGRVYARVEGKDNNLYVKSIVYFDKNNKRNKQIELDHSHKGKQPHVHRGYFHNERNRGLESFNLSSKEQKILDRVLNTWDYFMRSQ